MAKGKAEIDKKANRLEKLKIEYVEIDSVAPNPYNPNRQSDHDFNLLLKSMEEDGFTQPVIVRQKDMMIVDGEHRWRAAREMGMKKLPVVFVDFTDEQMRISTLRHNRARGSEDIELSAEVLRDLRELGALDWAQDSLMLDDTELQTLLDDVAAPEALAGEDFNAGWEPTKESDEEDGTDDLGREKQVSMTAAAMDRRREVEKKLAEAKTAEEKEMARELDDTYRVVVVFGGEEAAIVRSVLGDSPAETILELCRGAAEGAQDDEG